MRSLEEKGIWRLLRHLERESLRSRVVKTLRNGDKARIEVVAMICAYLLFLGIGLYSGRTTMDVDVISPHEGTAFRSSPVQLAASVSIRGNTVPDAKTTFTIYRWETGVSYFENYTDAEGIARLSFRAPSGNYTWHVAVTKRGYPTILSLSRGFSVTLSLVVDCLLPSHYVLAVSPVSFKARVDNLSGEPVEGANVTFYVDSTAVGLSTTDEKGIAKLSRPVTPGEHEWFASAGKDGEGGISDTTTFSVGESASYTTTEHPSPTGVVRQAESSLNGFRDSATAYFDASMAGSTSVLNSTRLTHQSPSRNVGEPLSRLDRRQVT